MPDHISVSSDSVALDDIVVGETYLIASTSERTYFHNNGERPRYGRVIGIDTYMGYGAGEGSGIPKGQLAHNIAEGANLHGFDLADTTGKRRMVAFVYVDESGELIHPDRKHVCSARSVVCTRDEWLTYKADLATRQVEQAKLNAIESERRAAAEAPVRDFIAALGFTDAKSSMRPEDGEAVINFDHYAALGSGRITITLDDLYRLTGKRPAAS